MTSARNAMARPRISPLSRGRPSQSIRFRFCPPSVIESEASRSRVGARMPFRLICATTAKIRPETTDRRLPEEARTRSRPGQPRDITMPTPNTSPPITAPDHDPGTAIIRASSTRKKPRSSAACTQTSAVEKHRSQTATRGPSCRRANSTVAARRQKRDRCAATPKTAPVIRPRSAAVGGSPILSMIETRSMRGSSQSLRRMHHKEYVFLDTDHAPAHTRTARLCGAGARIALASARFPA